MKKTGFSWTLTGGIFAGLVASLCCIGPLVSLTLGLGSFAASAWFAQWRPVFLGVTFALLGLAWYLTYRRPKMECEDGSCAQPPGRATRISLWLGTLVALAAAIYPSLSAKNQQIDATTIAASEVKLSVLIPSMDCPPCAKGIEATLRRTSGVIRAVVDYDSKNAVIVFDSSKTTAAQLIATIDRTGFKAEKVSQTSVPSSGGMMAKADACCAPGSSTSAAKSLATTRNTMSPDRISLFTVPLVCPAAPAIGCGSRAKPLLAQLEHDDSIAEAWLNSSGTILAIVGGESSSRETRAKAVQATFAAADAAATELDGESRKTALNDFLSGTGWHRGAGIDELSRQEAGIIAARLVRRLQAKIPLTETKAKKMEAQITEVFVRRFTGEKSDPQRPINERGWNEEILAIANGQLTRAGIAAFQEALAPGYRPQRGEN